MHGEAWSLEPGHSIGQTFQARHNDLCAIEALMDATTPAPGAEVVCALFEETPGGRLLHESRLPVSALQPQRYARFSIDPPLPASGGRRYYVEFTTRAAVVRVHITGLAQLATGVAYRDRDPVNTALIFRACTAEPVAPVDQSRQLAAALAREAALWQELAVTQATLQRLTDQQATLWTRLRAVHARLADQPSASAPGHD